ncbi:MAG TPA: hypothetical protein VL993_00305 [Stellaceae bacterium]|nr:hypothetical protein [Stellaceae bacterium]
MFRIAVAAALVSALAACSAVPVAGTFPVTVQQKMQSVGHWKILADDVALSLKARAPSDRPIFIEGDDSIRSLRTVFAPILRPPYIDKA